MPDSTDKPPTGDWTPRPDPTVLTTEALRREIQAQNERFQLQLEGRYGEIAARLDGMDEAQRLFRGHLDRSPSDTEGKIAQLAALHDERFRSFDLRIQELGRLQEEKFTSIATQFAERDTRVRETANMTKTAVDAALLAQQAQQEKQAEAFTTSISKSELQFGKQIDQMGELITSSQKATDDKFSDLKERLTRIEGAAVGQLATKSEQHQAGGANMAIIMAVIAGLSLIAAVILAVTRHA